MFRFLRAFILILLGAAIVAIAVANRHGTRLVLDPFINREVAASVEAPLFVYLFAALIVGVVLGASVMWIMQGKWRHTARRERREASIWRREAENLKRGLQLRASTVEASRLPPPLHPAE
jgi:uncharacterized integral membrane protein